MWSVEPSGAINKDNDIRLVILLGAGGTVLRGPIVVVNRHQHCTVEAVVGLEGEKGYRSSHTLGVSFKAWEERR